MLVKQQTKQDHECKSAEFKLRKKFEIMLRALWCIQGM